MKWDAFGRTAFFWMLGGKLGFVISVLCATVARPFDAQLWPAQAAESDAPPSPPTLASPPAGHVVATAILAVFYVINVLQELREMRRSSHSAYAFALRYLNNLYNLIDLALLIPLSTVVLSEHICLLSMPIAAPLDPYAVRGCNALLNLFSWIRLIEFAEVPLATGPLVIMFRKMLFDIVRYSMLYSFFFVGFTTSFYAIDREGSYLETTGTAPLEIFLWMAGAFDITPFAQDGFAVFILMFHIVTVGLLLTNMLIAMMANTFQAISENARTEWKFGWAQHIQAAESGASKGTLDRLYKALAAMDGVRQQEAPSLFDSSEDPGYVTVPTSQFLAVGPLTTDQLSNLA